MQGGLVAVTVKTTPLNEDRGEPHPPEFFIMTQFNYLCSFFLLHFEILSPCLTDRRCFQGSSEETTGQRRPGDPPTTQMNTQTIMTRTHVHPGTTLEPCWNHAGTTLELQEHGSPGDMAR